MVVLVMVVLVIMVLVMMVLVMMVLVMLPEYGSVQDLLDPLTVQTGLPAAPD